jgi:hypothetical protein
MGLFGKSKAEKLLDAAQNGDVAACRAALDAGANKNCESVRAACEASSPARYALRRTAPRSTRQQQPRHARAGLRLRPRSRVRDTARRRARYGWRHSRT